MAYILTSAKFGSRPHNTGKQLCSFSQRMDYEITIDHQNGQRMVKHNTNIKYGPNKQVVLSVDGGVESTSPLKARVESSLTYPGSNWAFIESVEERRPKEYHHNMQIRADSHESIEINSVYKMEPRHELKADVTTQNLRPIKIEGFLKPDPKNFEGHAEVTYGSDRYAGDATWVFNGRRMALSTRSAVEVSYPGRTVKAEGEFTRQRSTANGKLDVMWDVNRDPNKKVTVFGEVDANPDQPRFQVKTQWYPNQKVEVSGTFKNDGKGWYHVERDLEGSLNAVTSFRYRRRESRDQHNTNGVSNCAPEVGYL